VAFANGRADSMRVLLRATFDEVDGLEELARRLVRVDHGGSITRIVAGTTIDELRLIS
jgi:hypothetical protein